MKILTPNTKIIFTGRDDMESDLVVVKESWVENTYQLFEDDFNDTGVVFDIGANIGAFSVYAASLGARVFAFEPEPANFYLLNENVTQIDSPPITICNMAIAYSLAEKGYPMTKDGGNSKYSPDGEVMAACITLEEALNLNGIVYADVLKIDVEGAEYDILLNCDDDTLQKFRYITMEFHETDDSTFGLMVARLTKWFNVHIIGSHTTGGQIYAKRY